jgi:hypothetical protein
MKRKLFTLLISLLYFLRLLFLPLPQQHNKLPAALAAAADGRS